MAAYGGEGSAIHMLLNEFTVRDEISNGLEIACMQDITWRNSNAIDAEHFV